MHIVEHIVLLSTDYENYILCQLSSATKNKHYIDQNSMTECQKVELDNA